MQHFGDIMFTENVQAEQTRRGSREAYAKMTAGPAPEGLSEREAAFIAERDSFYMASVTQTGWPYVQHRGGPKGFLAVLDKFTLGMADYRGNKQYVSTGNLKNDGRVALFLMDYPNKARLKILAHAEASDADASPDLVASVAREGQGRVERVFVFRIDAFDWNCPQFITPRFSADEVTAAIAPKLSELERLQAENAALKLQLSQKD